MISSVLAAAFAAVLVVAPITAAEPETLCAVEGKQLDELSGLAVDAAGVWAIADDGRKTEVHRLDTADCSIIETRTARIDPRDTEDLAVGPDGALWVADTGDNDRRRNTVALIVLPERGEPRLHRLVYPDGPHDAEALLVDGSGVPVIVTKDATRPAGIYRTDGQPTGEGPIPLVRVGQLILPTSDTVGGPLGGLGSRLVTGAAATADRRVVAVRSYTDAWLYPAPDGDVVAALTGASPVRVPLPDEPQGEAIAFLPDGTLLSGSETRDGDVGELRAVPGAGGLVDGIEGVPTSGPPGFAADDGPGEWLPAALGVAGVAGFLLLATTGMVLRRR